MLERGCTGLSAEAWWEGIGQERRGEQFGRRGIPGYDGGRNDATDGRTEASEEAQRSEEQSAKRSGSSGIWTKGSSQHTRAISRDDISDRIRSTAVGVSPDGLSESVNVAQQVRSCVAALDELAGSVHARHLEPAAIRGAEDVRVGVEPVWHLYMPRVLIRDERAQLDAVPWPRSVG